MERVLGVGGYFMRATDPVALGRESAKSFLTVTGEIASWLYAALAPALLAAGRR